jgi:hypothetical protein
MRIRSFEDEAAECRRQAINFSDRPEAEFLLQLASSFEELATDDRAEPGD